MMMLLLLLFFSGVNVGLQIAVFVRAPSSGLMDDRVAAAMSGALWVLVAVACAMRLGRPT